MTCYLLPMFFENAHERMKAPYSDVCIVVVLNCVFCGSLHADRVPAHWKFTFCALHCRFVPDTIYPFPFYLLD